MTQTPNPPMSRVDTRVDDEQRRIYVTLVGPVAGPKVSGPIAALFATRPELTGYDMIYDIREYTGDVEAEHVRPIAEAYEVAQPDPNVPTRTAFLTFDRNFGFWAQAMNFQFPGRTHQPFTDPAEAEAWLASPR